MTEAKQTSREVLFDENFLKKLEYLFIISKKVFAGKMRAERRGKKVGSGIEFADHRDYAPGDDFRYVDWNVYGRMNKLLLRLFEEEEDLTVYLLLDASKSMTLGAHRYPGASAALSKIDYARRVVAALAYIALANLDRVNIIPFTGELLPQLTPKRGKGQIFRVFEFLAAIRAGGLTDMEASFKSFVHQAHRRGLAVVVSDFFDPHGYERGLKLLRHNRFEVFALQVCDPFEANPSVKGDVRLVDTETGEEQIATVSPAVVAAYQREFEDYCRRLENFCTSIQTGFVRTLTSTPFEDLVLKVFREGRFLK